MSLKTYTKQNAVKTAIPKLLYTQKSSNPAFSLEIQSLDGVFSSCFQIDAHFKQIRRFYEAVLVTDSSDKPKFHLANVIHSDNLPKPVLKTINQMVKAFIKHHLKGYVKQHQQFFTHCQKLRNERKNVTNIWDGSAKRFKDPNVNHEFLDADSGYALTSFSSEEHDSSSAGKIEVQDLGYTLQKDGYVKASNLVDSIYDNVAEKLLNGKPDKIKEFATSGASVGYGDIHENKAGKLVHDKSGKPVSKVEAMEYATANYWNAIMSSTFGFTNSEATAESYGDDYYMPYHDKQLGLNGYVYWN